jgi:Zn-dependent protease
MSSTNLFITNLITDPVFFLRCVVILIFSITLHELAHGWAAVSQGDDTPKKSGHLTFNPLVHMGVESILLLCIAGIAWGQMPVNPSKFRSPKLGNILVSVAGPLLNLALGILFILLFKLSAVSPLTGILSVEFCYLAAHINLMLFLFNLLPIPPLDGFYVASEFFPELKLLDMRLIGLFALTLFFVTPGFGTSLAEVATWIIRL